MESWRFESLMFLLKISRNVRVGIGILRIGCQDNNKY